jgi:phage tail-like protein
MAYDEITEGPDGRGADRLARFLPSFYQTDDLMKGLLAICEATFRSVEEVLDHIDLYFDPEVTPSRFIPWLASWMDLPLNKKWPEERQRRLIKRAIELYRWRGTRRGLAEYLRIYAGVEPIISEQFPGMRLGPETHLGINSPLGEEMRHGFTVTLPAGGYDVDVVREIIEAEKPAHTTYKIEILPAREGSA